MTDHRAIHSPEYQTGMHLPKRRPNCFTSVDNGRACGNCYDPFLHQIHLAHNPLCEGCAAGQIAARGFYQDRGL